MRVWDVHPGYLRRINLLAEHREVHALFSVILNHKKGYANHPETLRWKGCMGALAVRHGLLVEEMALRGYNHHSPCPEGDPIQWPEAYIDEPARQFAILSSKYAPKDTGRIPLPSSVQQLWAQHKYSILARDPDLYARIGQMVARGDARESLLTLSRTLAEALRVPPAPGRLMNALMHMWGYVSHLDIHESPAQQDPVSLVRAIQTRAVRHHVRYLVESTALSDLAYWASRAGQPAAPGPAGEAAS